ncbi:MAG: MerR family transcriptional regulator [Acidobacteria bacterium]|nr:MAG: MerR family transcriptional regulator [Acidobacteriota bacterium]
MDGARTFSIGSLANAAGVSRRTVRFYVQGGVLEPPVGLGRGAHYTEAHLARLMQIKSWQEQGVPLEAIRGRLQDRTSPARGAGRREQRRAEAAAGSPAANVTPGAAVPGRAWMRQPLLADYELHVAANRLPLSAAQLAALARALRDIVEEGDTE